MEESLMPKFSQPIVSRPECPSVEHENDVDTNGAVRSLESTEGSTRGRERGKVAVVQFGVTDRGVDGELGRRFGNYAETKHKERRGRNQFGAQMDGGCQIGHSSRKRSSMCERDNSRQTAWRIRWAVSHVSAGCE